MDSILANRMKWELNEIMKNQDISKSAIKIELIGDSFTDLKGEFEGPPDTPYEGGRFVVEMKISESYPFTPPKVRFVTKVWHPNVSSVTGAICLDILKDQWVASLTLKGVLLSLQALLSSPEPYDPQDAVVAKQYKEDQEMFKMTAMWWSSRYANGPYKNYDFERKVKNLVDMGVEPHKACVVLSMTNWNLLKAAEHLFN